MFFKTSLEKQRATGATLWKYYYNQARHIIDENRR